MRFSDNGYYIEKYVKCDNCGVLIYGEGIDAKIAGTDDDFVKPSLATSWTTNYDALVAGTATRYEITFTLRSGVTFHDGEPWNAAACKTNFDHIMGGDGVGPPPTYGSGKQGWALTGLHDWMGFTQQVYGWEAVGAMQFKLILDTYYEAVFRELQPGGRRAGGDQHGEHDRPRLRREGPPALDDHRPGRAHCAVLGGAHDAPQRGDLLAAHRQASDRRHEQARQRLRVRLP